MCNLLQQYVGTNVEKWFGSFSTKRFWDGHCPQYQATKTLWWTIFFLFCKWGICYPHPLQRHVETIQSIHRVIVNGASSGVHVLALHKSTFVSLKTEWTDLPPYVFGPSPPICTLLTISRLLTKPDPPPKSTFFCYYYSITNVQHTFERLVAGVEWICFCADPTYYIYNHYRRWTWHAS